MILWFLQVSNSWLILSQVFLITFVHFPSFFLKCLILCLYFLLRFLLDSDLEVETLREDNLCLLVTCSWHFSLVFLILVAKSFAYSAVSSLFSLVYHFFTAICRHLYCKMCGVKRGWIVGPLVLGFLPFLFRGFLTIYWWTSSPLERLKSLWILLALLDPRWWVTVASVRPGISFSPLFYNGHVENTESGIHSATPEQTRAFFLQSSPLCNRNVLTRGKGDTAMDTPLHGED